LLLLSGHFDLLPEEMAFVRSWQVTAPAAYRPPLRIAFTVKIVGLRLYSASIRHPFADHVTNSSVWAKDDG
jgi:hypothetical protein